MEVLKLILSGTVQVHMEQNLQLVFWARDIKCSVSTSWYPKLTEEQALMTHGEFAGCIFLKVVGLNVSSRNFLHWNLTVLIVHITIVDSQEFQLAQSYAYNVAKVVTGHLLSSDTLNHMLAVLSSSSVASHLGLDPLPVELGCPRNIEGCCLCTSHVIFETSCVNSKVMDDFLGLLGCQCDYLLLDFYSWLTAGMNLIVKFMLTLIFGQSDWLQLTFIFLLFLK